MEGGETLRGYNFNATKLNLTPKVSLSRKQAMAEIRRQRATYCRFEDHQYDRETKTWTLNAQGKVRSCPDKDCTFTHRVTRPDPCPIGNNCDDYNCTLLHSKSRLKPCRIGENCINEKCTFSHPLTRKMPCPHGANCYDHSVWQQKNGVECKYAHPRRMNRVCQYDNSCRRYGCTFLHPSDAVKDCPDGSQCRQPHDKTCPHKHPRHTRVAEDSNGNVYFM